MVMTIVCAGVVAVLLIGLAGFQFALAAGAPWGTAAYGGASARLSSRLRVTSAVAGVIWLAVARFFAAIALPGLPGLVPDGWRVPMLWVFVALFTVATVMNAISRSRIERAIWTPVAAVMLAATIIIALTI